MSTEEDIIRSHTCNMSTEEDIIRSAVLASLRNDQKLGEVTASPDNNDGLLHEGPSSAPETAKPDAETTTPATAQKISANPQKRKKRKHGADSNWKKLKGTIAPAKTGKISRRRKPTPTTLVGNPTQKAGMDKEDAGKNGGESFSAFMKRAVRTNAAMTSVVALDCEMVGVGPDGRTDALARVSVVNYEGDVLYDTFVKPGEEVTDYRTKWSGIREADVCETSSAVSAYEAQRVVGELLSGRIVVGHALRNDFRVLRIAHPWQKVRDTSLYYKKVWRRRGNSRPALRLVVAKVLGVDSFQKSEHDSCEDARAALALYKHNAKEWERSIRESGGRGKSETKSEK